MSDAARNETTRPVWLTRDDLAQRRVRLEFVLHNASTKKVRNTAQALLFLQQSEESAWDAAPTDFAGPHGAVRVAITNAYYDARNEGLTMETAADNARDAVLKALGWEAPA